MHSHLEQFFKIKYPSFFSNDKECTIECDDGWFYLLKTLFENIEYYCLNKKKIHPIFHQIKAKNGILSIYETQSDDVIDALILFAEDMSQKTCEVCGNRGVLRTKNMKIVCEEHSKTHEKYPPFKENFKIGSKLIVQINEKTYESKISNPSILEVEIGGYFENRMIKYDALKGLKRKIELKEHPLFSYALLKN